MWSKPSHIPRMANRDGIAWALAMEHGLAFWWLQASKWSLYGHKHGRWQQEFMAESTLRTIVGSLPHCSSWSCHLCSSAKKTMVKLITHFVTLGITSLILVSLPNDDNLQNLVFA